MKNIFNLKKQAQSGNLKNILEPAFNFLDNIKNMDPMTQDKIKQVLGQAVYQAYNLGKGQRFAESNSSVK